MKTNEDMTAVLELIPILSPQCILIYEEKRAEIVQLEDERTYLINETAYEILREVDGEKNIKMLVSLFNQNHNIDKNQIAIDILNIFQSLCNLKIVTYR